tara:strand:- start:304 stop:552 length:249 start_codon:yes stop_codon:yes gene_type:complete
MPAPRRLRDVSNIDFGVLNTAKNKHLVRFDSTAERYKLSSKDDILTSTQVLDGDLPDDFTTQIESEIDAANLEFRGIDAGTF